MDLPSFLSSLPFIIPVPQSTTSWPPVHIIKNQSGCGSDNNNEQRRTTKNQQHVTTITKHTENNVPTIGTRNSTIILNEIDKYNRSFYISIEAIIPFPQHNTDGQKRNEEKQQDEQLNSSSTSSINSVMRTQPLYFTSVLGDHDHPFLGGDDRIHGGGEGGTTGGDPHRHHQLHSKSTKQISNQQEQFDVGMNRIQIALENRNVRRTITTQQQQQQQSHYNINSNLHSPVSNRRKMLLTIGNDHVEEIVQPISIVYIRIQNKLYAVDMDHVQNIEIIPEVYVQEGDEQKINNLHQPTSIPATTELTPIDATTMHCDDDFYDIGNYSGAKEIKKPPSLVMYFGTNQTDDVKKQYDFLLRLFAFRPLLSMDAANNNGRITKKVSKYRSISDINEEKETLTYVRDQLLQVLKGQGRHWNQGNHIDSDILVIPTKLLQSDINQSPTVDDDSNNSSSSPLQAGQKHSDPTHDMLLLDNEEQSFNNMKEPNSTDSKKAISPSTKTVEVDPILVRWKRRKMYHDRFNSHVSLFNRYLDFPMEELEKITKISAAATNQNQNQLPDVDVSDKHDDDLPTTTNQNMIHNLSFSPLLNTIAKLQNSSYVSSEDMIHALQRNQLKLQNNQNQMDDCLNQFFPAAPQRNNTNKTNTSMNSRRNLQYNTNYTKPLDRMNPNNTENLQRKADEMNSTTGMNNEDESHFTIKDFDELMKQHKKIMTSRYKLFLIPTKG